MRLIFDNGKEIVAKYLEEKQQQFSFIDSHTVVVNIQEKSIPEVLFGISRIGVSITDIEIQKPTLEDVFLQIARKE
jgi:ABC-type multidrug transport system ATPase subunit